MGKMISVQHKGSFRFLERFLKRAQRIDFDEVLKRYGDEGVRALKKYTPADTGETAQSWSYEIIKEEGSTTICWKNSNVKNGVVIAVLLQYGHATNNGGYVQGIDYVNPAMKETFEKIAEALWEEVRAR